MTRKEPRNLGSDGSDILPDAEKTSTNLTPLDLATEPDPKIEVKSATVREGQIEFGSIDEEELVRALEAFA